MKALIRRPAGSAGIRRIVRIGFVHDDEDWVAEVGQTLRRTRTKTAICNGRRQSVTGRKGKD